MQKTLPFLDGAAAVFAVGALVLVTAVPAFAGLPWIKAAPALLWSVSFLVARRPGGFLLAAALAFAALGDLFLAIGGPWSTWGAVAFAAMQVLYSVNFWIAAYRRPRPRKGALLGVVVFGALAALILILGWSRLGDQAPLMAVYAVLLTAMAAGSSAAGRSWFLALGGALFFLSDGMILWFRAWPAAFSTEVLILVPYYLGQYLIVRETRKG